MSSSPCDSMEGVCGRDDGWDDGRDATGSSPFLKSLADAIAAHS